MIRIILSILIAFIAFPVIAAEPVADWVCVQPNDLNPNTVVYTGTFKIDFDVTEAYFKFTCYTPTDIGATHYQGYINSIQCADGSYWRDVQYVNVGKALRNGQNEIDIEVSWSKEGMPGPVLAKLVAKGKDKDGNSKSVTFRTGADWKYSIGEFNASKRAKLNRTVKPVAIIAPADSWDPAEDPIVMPKIYTSSVVGVTSADLSGGGVDEPDQFSFVKDCSDKYYFMNALGWSSITARVTAGNNYQYPGQWFWGYDKELASRWESACFNFAVSPDLDVLPDWYKKQENPVMLRKIGSDSDGIGLSLWSELLTKTNEDFYSEIEENFGESVHSIYPGIYGDFGEARFPSSNPGEFWAGDDFAVKDFRDKMLTKYGNINALDVAWKTGYKSSGEIAYPKFDGSASRRWILDFMDWYYGSMTEYTTRVCGIATTHCRNAFIAPKLTCADETPSTGQDNSAVPKALSKLGAGVLVKSGSYLSSARIASACKFYGTRLRTEIGPNIDQIDLAKQLFIDASYGSSGLVADPDTMLTGAETFSKYRRNLLGQHSITDIALFFPTSWHRCNINQPYPPKLAQAAEEIRDIMDYDVVDERMVLDGALEKYRVLAMFDGNFTEQTVCDKIAGWVRGGGNLLLLADELPFSNIEGRAIEIPTDESETGKGHVIVWNGDWNTRKDYYKLIYDSAYSSTVGAIKGPDGAADGVWASMFKNRVLYFNTTDHPVRVSENISESFALAAGLDYQTRFLKYCIDVPAYSLASHFLDRQSVEFAVEFEESGDAKGLPVMLPNQLNVGKPGRSVKVEPRDVLKMEFRVRENAVYGVCCIANPVIDGKAELIIDGKKVSDIGEPSGPHDFYYPLNASLKLKPGKHSIEFRVLSGVFAADKVMFTTDTDLAGFTYGFVDPQVEQSW